MGRTRKDKLERKEKITIRLKKRIILRLREIDNYNQLIEDLITEYLKKKGCN